MKKREEGTAFDKEGNRIVLRKRDYFADMGGQWALGIMANLVGQLTYFYTDKIGVTVGAVGVMMMISKIVDAFTDVLAGNIVDHEEGDERKYYAWMRRLMVPASVCIVLMFLIPKNAGNMVQLIYVLITNLMLSAVLYTMIATPFAAVMVVRTKSNSERGTMGLFRAMGNYGAGMMVAILTIPLTNALGGNQSAWIRYGAIMGLLVLLLFLVCYRNGVRTRFISEWEDAGTEQAGQEERAVPFLKAMGLLLRNRYWIIVLLFNLITSISTSIVASSGTYYCKWIFGDDNLVALIGAGGLLATLAGFVISKPVINKLGVQKTVYVGLLGGALFAGIRCLSPENFPLYIATSLLGSLVQIPLMCLYGVLTAMTVDYNEWKYDTRLVAISGGAVSFGSKVGAGIGAAILTLLLAAGKYDASLQTATASMKWAIFAFSNILPLVANLVMFLIFTRFDLEKKLPAMQAEVKARHQQG